MFADWKRRRAAKRVKGGDGRPLEPFRWWQLVSGRKLLYLRPSPGRTATYAVDVRQWGKQAGDDTMAHLYRDGRHVAQSRLPAVFALDGGDLEVTATTFGLRRCHFVDAEGAEHQLTPDPRSAIGRRLGLERERPVLSRAIGVVSTIMLLVGVTLTLLEIAGPISAIPPLADRYGAFEPPLPLWLTIASGLAAVLASMERSLRLRYHWLLDGAAG
ncbi:hypothetical protein ACHAAC_16415 [Aeromicrobium sp. CF4.19]|uniref:hypothetical protein n=1 Tax=Aeromicrobium sp. CF4.19 TaxID=3373082 RepID=UPI003EE6ADBF